MTLVVIILVHFGQAPGLRIYPCGLIGILAVVAVSVFATGGGIPILQILLSTKTRLVIAIFLWDTIRGLCLLTLRIAVTRTKRRKLLLLLKSMGFSRYRWTDCPCTTAPEADIIGY
jgi:hypothetical protein